MTNSTTSILRALALLFALAAASAHAQDTGTTVMLVAKPGLEPPYGETVLIAIPSGQSQHAGFIINRPLQRTLAQLFPGNPAASKSSQPLHLGGPVMLDTMYAVLKASDDGDRSTIPLFDDVRMVYRAESITRIVEEAPDAARYFIGFVSWAPGELDHEIASGYWYVMRPQADLVFRDDDGDLWNELVRRARGTVNFQTR